jgi:hypothetical protein
MPPVTRLLPGEVLHDLAPLRASDSSYAHTTLYEKANATQAVKAAPHIDVGRKTLQYQVL